MDKTVFELSEYSMIFYMKHVKLIKKLYEISTNFWNNVEKFIQSQTRIYWIESCLFQTLKEKSSLKNIFQVSIMSNKKCETHFLFCKNTFNS
mgnify:CR=1 FL=1